MYMASLLRSPKSGSDWGPSELLAYNIDIQFQDPATFFAVNPLPQPAVADEVLTRLDADDMTNDSNYKFVRYMDLAMDPVPAEESAVDDFAVICREQCHAKTDVCVVDEDNILLLVQEDKRHKEGKDPEPQLIAGAIAVFQANNTKQTRVLGEEAIDAKVMPGITLVGSSPTFYKIPVTKQLAQAVVLGRFPTTQTVVYAHLPAVPRPA